ncbi:MAG: glycosyltransferase family 4 protein [Actinobacteria bacterium]|jgi:phosphatidylinositol alpha-mannosyltransferase|nr:glycosyltransferase family 4 protein [Actinomycetota bacterium]MCL6095942.1 glycosyltransferase family 4 protein [Actinomycetota bacterium]
MDWQHLRIAMVCPYSWDRPGGVKNQVKGLAEGLIRQGHEVVVVSPASSPPKEPWVLPVGRATPLPANGSIAPVALGPRAALLTAKVLHEHTFDIVHLHEPLAPGPNQVFLLTSKVPIIGTYHRAGASIPYRLYGRLLSPLLWRMKRSVAVSEAAKATALAVLGRTAGNVSVLWNGIDLDEIDRADPWPVDGPTVIFVGRHEIRKGLQVLLNAFKQLPSHVNLWVVGDGPLSEQAKRTTTSMDNVSFLGVLDQHELASRLKAAHILCAPSLAGESFGMVLLEGMASRCVVVASDISGYREVLDGYGVLVPPGDPSELAAAIANAIDDWEYSRGMAAPYKLEEAHSYAASFSFTKLSERYVQQYRSMLQQV